MTLADLGHAGSGALAMLHDHGNAIRAGKTSLLFEGVGTTDLIILLARGLHINGVGCRVVPLVRMRRMIHDADFAEELRDIDCLVVLNAQDRHRGNPLQDSYAAEVEYLVRQRYDNRKTTILQVAFVGDGGDDRSYWSDEFWDLLGSFKHVTMTALEDMGRKSK